MWRRFIVESLRMVVNPECISAVIERALPVIQGFGNCQGVGDDQVTVAHCKDQVAAAKICQNLVNSGAFIRAEVTLTGMLNLAKSSQPRRDQLE